MDRNPEIPFTYQYAQPEEYRFSLDSVEMAWEVAQHLRSRPMRRLRLVAAGESSDAGGEGDPLSKSLSRMQVLDLCAGCGIVGFDFQYHMPEIEKIDFVEIQNTYKSYFEKNLEMVLLRRPQLVDKNFNFLEMNYEELMKDEKFHHHYDLILCNPPYVSTERMSKLPAEYKREPVSALLAPAAQSGADSDGLSIIRKVISRAGRRLKPNGMLLLEVRLSA